MASTCLLCASTHLEKVQEQSLDIAGVGPCKLAFVVCKACGFLHQNPLVAPEDLAKHYELFSNYTIPDPEAARKAPPAPHTRRLMTLRRDAFPDAKSIYEIGAAAGAALHAFRQDGLDVGGCDPSRTATAQANDIFGIALDRTDAERAAKHAGRFDVVLMSHVLEHLRDPLPTLQSLRANMRDGAGLLIEVPCATALDLLPPGWFAFEHISYFSPATLTAMLEAAGFEPLEYRINLRAFIYPVIAMAARAARPLRLHRTAVEVAEAVAFARDVAKRETTLWSETSKRLEGITGDVAVWGAGVHTSRLLAETPLARNAAVKMIVDRDTQKWGRRQGPYPICSPSELPTGADGPTVVISSYAFESQIKDGLLKMGVTPARIVTLYEGRGASLKAA
jgi:SAM-dependent methyltransferase